MLSCSFTAVHLAKPEGLLVQLLSKQGSQGSLHHAAWGSGFSRTPWGLVLPSWKMQNIHWQHLSTKLLELSMQHIGEISTWIFPELCKWRICFKTPLSILPLCPLVLADLPTAQTNIFRQEIMASGCTKRSLDWGYWILGKISSQKEWLELEQAAQEGGESPSLQVIRKAGTEWHS